MLILVASTGQRSVLQSEMDKNEYGMKYLYNETIHREMNHALVVIKNCGNR